MGAQKRLAQQRKRRKLRVKSSFQSRGMKPRVSVFRSLNHIYAQIIDDNNHVTLASCSTKNLVTTKEENKSDFAKKVGLELSKKAKELSIDKVFFDRGRFLYHGRIKALADGLREGGLEF